MSSIINLFQTATSITASVQHNMYAQSTQCKKRTLRDYLSEIQHERQHR